MRRRLIWWLMSRDEREAVVRLRGWFHNTHYANLWIRRNGVWEQWEADVLRVLGRLVHPKETR